MFLTHRPWPPTQTKKAAAGAVGATPTPLSMQDTLPPFTHLICLVHVGTLAQQQLHAGRITKDSRSMQWCRALLHKHMGSACMDVQKTRTSQWWASSRIDRQGFYELFMTL